MTHPTVPPDSHVHKAAVPSDAIRLAKAATGGSKTDFRSLLVSSLQESGNDAAARNKRSSAAGAYQFTERTWLALVQRHGRQLGHADAADQITTKGGSPVVASPDARARILSLRSDTGFAGAIAARYFDENRAQLAKSLGRPASENEVRMAYLLGASGASRLIKAAQNTPAIPTSQVVASAVSHNPTLFRNHDGSIKTASDAVASLNHHFDTAARLVDRAVGVKVSAFVPTGTPVDDEIA